MWVGTWAKSIEMYPIIVQFMIVLSFTIAAMGGQNFCTLWQAKLELSSEGMEKFANVLAMKRKAMKTKFLISGILAVMVLIYFIIWE